jgi:hypothetical protein
MRITPYPVNQFCVSCFVGELFQSTPLMRGAAARVLSRHQSIRAEDDHEAAGYHAAVGKHDDNPACREKKEAHIAHIFVAKSLHSPFTIFISASVSPYN